jgi:3-isopropylmalate/(R)-2-methylmalate dehydratase large subunit
MSRTLFEKVWDAHVVRAAEGEPALLYIELHLIHEVTSPQAFEGLRAAGRSVRRPDLTIGTIDHNVPTTDRSLPIVDSIAEKQMALLRSNCSEFGISLFDIDSADQGIVHVIGPALIDPTRHDDRLRR